MLMLLLFLLVLQLCVDESTGKVSWNFGRWVELDNE